MGDDGSGQAPSPTYDQLRERVAQLEQQQAAHLAAEEALRESEQRLRAHIDNSPMAVIEFDPQFRITRWSQQAERLFGWSAAEVLGRAIQEMRWVCTDDVESVRQESAGLLSGERPRSVNVNRNYRKDGSIVHCEWYDSAIYDSQGHLISILSRVLDITERKRAEEALRHAEAEAARRAAELQSLFDTIDFPLMAFDVSGRVTKVNTAAQDLFGTDPVGFDAQRWGQLITHHLAAKHADGRPGSASELPVHRALQGETVKGLVGRLQNGPSREVVVEASSRPVRQDGQVVGAVTVLHDITERTRAEEALRHSEEKFAKAFQGNTAAMAITRLRDGVYIDVNDRWLEANGFSRDDAIGRASTQINVWKTPEDRDGFARKLQQRGSVQNEERRFMRSGGEQWTGLVSAQVGVLSGEPIIISSIIDITERKRAEEALRESEAALKEANTRKDDFLGMLSHELRNPLMPIRNSLYILEHAASGGEQAKHAQAVIGRQVAHLNRLVDDLLDVTRIASGKIHLQRERIELRDLIARTVEDHRSAFAASEIDLQVRAAADPLFVNADATRLAQLLGNLLHNALKFAGRGGQTTVLTSKDAERHHAVIRVCDTGAGIPPEALPHLFEPFMQADHTLDRSRGGLGLGLALVKGLVELHGGQVSAHSEGVGKGAEFTVRLPLDQGPDAAMAVRPTALVANTRRRVLVIEDNVDAADSLCMLLELDGHHAAVAHSGPDAIRKAHEFKPEVVLCDIGLPDMDGHAVARAFRGDLALRGAFLVALSGYALPEDIAKATEAGFDRHLAKPPSLEKIRELLALGPKATTD